MKNYLPSKDKYKGVEDFEAKEGIYRELYTPVLAIAKRHEGYQTLWRICYQLNDSGLLRSLMHDSCGPKGGFSKFVFDQLIKNHQYAKLLKLGEEFQEELASFLKDKIELRWLHEIFLSQFSSASETLHSLALYQDDSSALIDKLEFPKLQMRNSLADRRRLLNLSKIAAAAGKEIGFELEKRRIDADLHILKLQEEVLAFYGETTENPEMNKLIPSEELIKMCLRGDHPKLALLAFEVFAWTSSSFRSSNRSLLEACWWNAAEQDDWVALAAASTAGWSDEMALKHLRESILFQASYLCYGPETDTYGGGFDEVLPLMKDDVDFTSLRDSGSSVEAILMQHKNFSEAGKLMLTAITLGKEGIDVITEAEGELAMES
ncbi:hypothetical protein HPP92_000881 [Vanilla planifolia]|uniref:Nucleoporin Nup133/Nup155-like C-terminal domain-containing protein n=1 Tax=Vanilla planifolia TaxID=51239 RepID=A0A835RPP8_VANPL|nr:hypothetical protein HPP92_000881 [Vanilla planifolia]